MAEALFRLQDVSKVYGGRRVLEIDELEIERGEILAVVGPSGAGKSTLLRILNFLEAPSKGRICFDSQWIDGADSAPLPVRRRITTVFQSPLLLKRSVRGNVRYGLQLRARRDCDELVDDVLQQVGLAALGAQDAKRLSGGEAQRVALARAMILRPDVLLLDEPTANLDPQNVALIERIVRRLNEVEKTTIVLVTHNLFQARRLANRVAFFLEGELIEVADSTKFFESPRDARSAAFVGGDMIY